MVTTAGARVEIDGHKFGRSDQFEMAFLHQLLGQCLASSLAALDTTTWHMPARHIGMAHQENLTSLIKCRGANPQCHAAGQRKPDMDEPGDQPRTPMAQLRRRGHIVRHRLRATLPVVMAHIMFQLAHISDIHLGPLPKVSLAELASKRITGYVNWHRNRRKHLIGNTLDQLLDRIRAASPDHIAITGDLVNLATDTEIETARRWLESHFDPASTTLVPGNHDAYVPGAFAKSTTAWRPWMGSDGGHEQANLFPIYRKQGPVALIGLSTANATLPFMATGKFGRLQANATGKLLDRAEKDGLFRVIMIHHPPLKGATSWHKRMHGSGRFSNMLKRHGAELVLHGHTHLNTQYHLIGKNGLVPVAGIASASQGPGGNKPAASFNLFDIDGKSGNWRLSHKRMSLSDGGFEQATIGLT